MSCNPRIKFLYIFFLASFLIVLSKLFYWQVIESERLSALASDQYYFKREIPAERGKIKTRDNFPLVMNQKNYLLYADPNKIKNSSEELLSKLKKYINCDKVSTDSLKDKNLFWVSVAKNIDQKTKLEIEKEKIPGIGFENKDARFYPEASMSASLLGFVGEDKDGFRKGFFGIEGFYDGELKGKSGVKYFEKDALERPIPLGVSEEEKLIPGRDLILNIDRSLQFSVEKRLKEGIDKYGAVSGSITIVNPQNGAVLAMASFPAYDPDKFYLFDSSLYRNLVISSLFEPGSIFKPIVMASALDSGSIKLTDICSICYGPRKISDYEIKTWNDKYYPNSTMVDIIVHSDNVGMVYLSEKMGATIIFEYLKRFKLGENTGIDLQGEISSDLKGIDLLSEIDIATISFGQGIAFTPIQVLMSISAIANKGELYQPQVVNSIVEGDKIVKISPKKRGSPISSKAAREVTKMMVEAVEKGEAKWAKPKGYVIAGKTGTAQIPIAGHYDPEKTIASFVGFAPAFDPKFAMLVTLNEPKSSQWGSETAAPLWFSIASDVFRLWDIPPETK